MKEYVFNYYKDFECVKDKCKHTCCAGWNIAIDKKTLKSYKKNKSTFKNTLTNGIDFSLKQFRLDENKRCVFLNQNNLCDIIINCGKSALCQVCRDHPRFRTFLKNRVEMGLGLTCEESCRIILNSKEKMHLVPTSDKKEKSCKQDKDLLSFREGVLSIMQDRSVSINNRLDTLFEKYNFNVDLDKLDRFFAFIKTLEYLDRDWKINIDGIRVNKYPKIDNDDVFEQLICYFIYRHVCSCGCDFSPETGLIFSVYSSLLIWCISKEMQTELTEIARAYSSEIEYSNQNLVSTLDFIERNRRLNNL